MTEDQAEEMIAFAEEAALHVEAAEKVAKAQAAAEGIKPAPPKKSAAAALFPDDVETTPQPVEARPTVESLFGPLDAPVPAEAPLDPEQVFGDKPSPAQKPDEDE